MAVYYEVTHHGKKMYEDPHQYMRKKRPPKPKKRPY